MLNLWVTNGILPPYYTKMTKNMVFKHRKSSHTFCSQRLFLSRIAPSISPLLRMFDLHSITGYHADATDILNWGILIGPSVCVTELYLISISHLRRNKDAGMDWLKAESCSCRGRSEWGRYIQLFGLLYLTWCSYIGWSVFTPTEGSIDIHQFQVSVTLALPTKSLICTAAVMLPLLWDSETCPFRADVWEDSRCLNTVLFVVFVEFHY